MMLKAILTAAFFTFAFGQCIYSDTECQCVQAQAGRTCLRYYSGSGSSTQCETYECGTGFVCDCAGTDMCDVTDCSLMRTVYRPVGTTTLTVGQIVDCQMATQVTCVTPRNAVMPPASASPSASSSAAPSASSSPAPSSSSSPAPSASSSPIPSASSSPAPSSSSSPAPSASSSPAPSASSSPAPSASSSPAPSASSSPAPSASASPSASSSTSPAPSASSSPSASASTSPSPSPSSSSTVVPLGGACTATSTCATGTSCSCTGFCSTNVNIQIDAQGDDTVVPVVCGTNLGAVTTGFGDAGTWFYSGACNDVYLLVSNSRGGHTGVAASIIDQSTNTQYVTRVDGADLTGTVLDNPPNLDFFTDPAYDFSIWSPVVLQTKLINDSPYIDFANNFGGATVWSHTDGHLGAGDLGSAYYRVQLPFC